jgi:hypothetical protein
MTPPGILDRPLVTRETRRLLAATAFALLALWGLARLRFPEAAPVANPVPPLLAQLVPPARFSELTAEVNGVTERIRSALLVVPLIADDGEHPRLALRLRSGLGAAVAPVSTSMLPPVAAPAVMVDRPSGLMLIGSDSSDDVMPPRPAVPRDVHTAQYLIAASSTPEGGIYVRPVYVSLWPAPVSPVWKDVVWHAAADSVTPGTFLFTAGAELVGVAAGRETDLTIVPARVFYAAAEALLGAPRVPAAGRIGVEVTTVTAPLAAATGVSAGVLVVAVESNGPATEHLRPGDVIVAVNDRTIAGEAEWRAVVGRARAGDELRIRVSSNQGIHEALIVAAPFPTPAPAGFGAQLRRIGDRTEVVTVEAGSAAAEAGLIGGDVITRAGDIDNPTPRQVMSVLDTDDTAPLLVLFTRERMPHATAIAR